MRDSTVDANFAQAKSAWYSAPEAHVGGHALVGDVIVSKVHSPNRGGGWSSASATLGRCCRNGAVGQPGTVRCRVGAEALGEHQRLAGAGQDDATQALDHGLCREHLQ